MVAWRGSEAKIAWRPKDTKEEKKMKRKKMKIDEDDDG